MSSFSDALQKILAALDRQEIRYCIGGSIASSSHGLPRFTNDVDFVVDFEGVDLEEFFAALAGEFYLDSEQAKASIAKQRAFNVIHVKAGYKFDFFPSEKGPFGEQQLMRRIFVQSAVPNLEDVELAITSAEDTVLAKLRWYRAGGGVSDRQWNDILGVLGVQQEKLDVEYLRQWAGKLGLTDLLEEALSRALPLRGPERGPSSEPAG